MIPKCVTRHAHADEEEPSRQQEVKCRGAMWTSKRLPAAECESERNVLYVAKIQTKLKTISVLKVSALVRVFLSTKTSEHIEQSGYTNNSTYLRA